MYAVLLQFYRFVCVRVPQFAWANFNIIFELFLFLFF